MEELDKLIEAVEGGVSVESHFNAVWNPMGKQWINGSNAMKADDGSLDAAKALHEALLPNMMWSATPLGDFRIVSTQFLDISDSGYQSRNNPARAWLIAILKAYRSTQGETA